MNIEKKWEEIRDWLSKEKRINLPRGSEFEVSFDGKMNEIVIVPLQTGIPRRVGKEEWHRFGEKFNEVEENGYDPFRPGHYARVTFNSSYLVAILKAHGNSIGKGSG